MDEHGYSVEVPEGYDEAVVRTRLALRGEGFSIISESDVGGMLAPTRDAGRQYLFLGAWNVPLGRTELGRGLDIGSHLSCNLVVQEVGSSAIVAALDPVDTVPATEPGAMVAATDARDAIRRVLEQVAKPA